MNDQTRFWRWQAAADSQAPQLYIYGPIVPEAWWDGETAPRQFRDELANLGDVPAFDLHVMSEGGDVFAGNAIHAMISQHPAKVTAYVDGIAASIASLILMAADRIVMPGNAMLMVHKPWTFGMGNADEFRKQADALDAVGESMVAAYTARTGQSADRVREIMAAETWMTAAEAKDLGFADEVLSPVNLQASVRQDGSWQISGQVIDPARFARRKDGIPSLAPAPDTSPDSLQVAATEAATLPEGDPDADRLRKIKWVNFGR